MTDVLHYNHCKLKHYFSGIELLQKQLNEIMVSRLEASTDKYNIPSDDYNNIGVYLSPKINLSSSTFVVSSPYDSSEIREISEIDSIDLTTKHIYNNTSSNSVVNNVDAQKPTLSDRQNSCQWKKSDGDVELI